MPRVPSSSMWLHGFWLRVLSIAKDHFSAVVHCRCVSLVVQLICHISSVVATAGSGDVASVGVVRFDVVDSKVAQQLARERETAAAETASNSSTHPGPVKSILLHVCMYHQMRFKSPVAAPVVVISRVFVL